MELQFSLAGETTFGIVRVTGVTTWSQLSTLMRTIMGSRDHRGHMIFVMLSHVSPRNVSASINASFWPVSSYSLNGVKRGS